VILVAEPVAIEAVARHFSAKWGEGRDLTIAGKRIAVDVATLKARAGTKPRLRFDKVALGLIRRLQDAAVPARKTVVVTITAPIRQDSKTGAVLQDRIRRLLARRSAQPRLTDTIHGNHVQIRVFKHAWSRASKLIGLVHNPDSDAGVLFEMARSLLAASPADWLVIDCEQGLPLIDTYRHVYSQLIPRPPFQKALMVLGGGRVEALIP
jgi:hypothetical protein